jgi:hypothetical protein
VSQVDGNGQGIGGPVLLRGLPGRDPCRRCPEDTNDCKDIEPPRIGPGSSRRRNRQGTGLRRESALGAAARILPGRWQLQRTSRWLSGELLRGRLSRNPSELPTESQGDEHQRRQRSGNEHGPPWTWSATRRRRYRFAREPTALGDAARRCPAAWRSAACVLNAAVALTAPDATRLRRAGIARECISLLPPCRSSRAAVERWSIVQLLPAVLLVTMVAVAAATSELLHGCVVGGAPSDTLVSHRICSNGKAPWAAPDDKPRGRSLCGRGDPGVAMRQAPPSLGPAA